MTTTSATDPVRVLLITEGTYPFHWGGVSTWAHLLLRDLTDVDFTLLSIVTNPRLKPQFELPPSVRRFIPVPLWGICNVLETWRGMSLVNIFRRKRQTTEAIAASLFVPLFQPFLQAIFGGSFEPETLGRVIHQMYRYFLAYDFDATLRSQAVWNCFVDTAQHHFPPLAAAHGYPNAEFILSDLTSGMKWLYHWLFPLAKPLPQVDVVHAAMVGLSTLVAVAVQREYDAGYFLTEHGIYLRETYLAEASASDSLFLKLFKVRFARCMTALSYALADQISPCCDYNQRWELKNGAPADRLKTIYYGVDPTVFTPAGKIIGEPPVVVWVGRINPLKDLETLLRAAALVHQVRPDIQFKLFGNAAPEDEAYSKAMGHLHNELGLGDAVVFCGFAATPETAFNQGDIIVMSSISEALPFSILEAMLCGKPIVSTAVGGVLEEIEGCGIAVEPRNPHEMAEAILKLMNDPVYCAALGRAARERSAGQFGLHQSSNAHRSSYLRLSRRHQTPAFVPEPSSIGFEQETMGESFESIAISVETGNEYQLAGGATPGDEYARYASLPVETRQMTSVIQHTEFKVIDQKAAATLAVEVSRRVPLPIDFLEITALLESMGITDEVAAQRYGVPDVFTLADAVLPQVRYSSWQLNTNPKA